MKILADENMASLDPLFADLGEVRRLPGRAIGPQDLQDVDALLVRSVTKVTPELLAAAPALKFVGTATIGTDHLAIEALEQRGIRWTNAPGCNADAVGEYVLQALLILAVKTCKPLAGQTIGLVGLGNTGSAVQKRLSALGIEVLRCDPPKQRSGAAGPWFSLAQLIERCDVISLHVPLITDGDDPTLALLDEARLGMLKSNAWLVNACRGEVVDNDALIRVKARRPDLRLALDVWEGEPRPKAALVELADIATAHIAGYSVEGKIRGSQMLHQALVQGRCPTPEMATLLGDNALPPRQLEAELDDADLLALIRSVYDLAEEDGLFRAALPDGFDKRRQANLARREFSALPVVPATSKQAKMLANLGFTVEEKNEHGI
ncbi:4-phosphoerythronate dehydrogenase [Ferrimonas pelagia]|uniref:Erythronate-4-phosphate dehydrogenase n=1 Tax=Ferrimonas pelagia TaxID=1177826 RepID=A0ABP9EAQ3_9GAMM